MMIVKRTQIDIGQNIDIMHQKWFVALQECSGVLDTSSGIEQVVTLVGYMYFDAEVVVGRQEIDDLIP